MITPSKLGTLLIYAFALCLGFILYSFIEEADNPKGIGRKEMRINKHPRIFIEYNSLNCGR